MNFFFAALVTESNSFSNIPTSRSSFVEHSGPDAIAVDYLLSSHVRHFARRAAEMGVAANIGLCAYAVPSAPVVHADYLALRDELLAGLERGQPADAVFLYLHGAMVSQGCLDCEGDILRAVRGIVGPKIPVLVVLDPHAHLTQAMLENADVLTFMKEYPHTDGAERIDDLFRIARAMREGRARPVAAVADCHIVGIWPTQAQPIRGFTDRLTALEDGERILSVSFVHGFPWGDTPDTGSRVLVYANADLAAAQGLASSLAAEIWEMRASSQPQLISVDAALDVVGAAGCGPVVLADYADNAGGGAPADSSFILRAVLARGMTDIAFALFYDPLLVDFCRQVGVGGRIRARIGGKISEFSGEPVNLEVEVKALARDATQLAFGSTPDRLGDTAWIQGNGVDIVLSSVRTQCFDPSVFTHLGLDCTARRAVAVKSMNHFRVGFAPIARQTLLVGTPGALNVDFAHLPYRVFDRPYWPRNEDIRA
jgi:microcystin degradation protein MlrC